MRSMLVVLVLGGCSSPEDAPLVRPEVVFACDTFECVPPPTTPPTLGDPDAGLEVLRNGDLMKCGVPLDTFESLMPFLGEVTLLEGRTGDGANIPYEYAVGTSERGARVVSFSCFDCHASEFDGELVLGMGDHLAGLGSGLAGVALAKTLTSDPDELIELDVFEAVLEVMDPYTPDTRGLSAGNSSMMAVAARRDPLTSNWLDEPHMEPPDGGVPYNVPAWWTTKYKHALFANSVARGNHTNFALNPAHVCTESPEAMEDVLALGPDLAAYIVSIEEPVWPWGIDDALADQGQDVFEATCAGCHGTYRDGVVDFPNVVVPIEVIDTDPWAAEQQPVWQRAWDEHFSINPFGEGMEWAPQAGYMAPPLVGLWASAPYFHNGAAPTLADVIDSAARPAIWRRASLDSGDYDQEAVGWNIEVLDTPKDSIDDPAERYEVYDTSRRGYGNTGHPFGDGLDDGEREALLEYLKTL